MWIKIWERKIESKINVKTEYIANSISVVNDSLPLGKWLFCGDQLVGNINHHYWANKIIYSDEDPQPIDWSKIQVYCMLWLTFTALAKSRSPLFCSFRFTEEKSHQRRIRGGEKLMLNSLSKLQRINGIAIISNEFIFLPNVSLFVVCLTDNSMLYSSVMVMRWDDETKKRPKI